MKGLAYNPSAISEEAIDVFAAHAKAPMHANFLGFTHG
jgi:hypothetical protein